MNHGKGENTDPKIHDKKGHCQNGYQFQIVNWCVPSPRWNCNFREGKSVWWEGGNKTFFPLKQMGSLLEATVALCKKGAGVFFISHGCKMVCKGNKYWVLHSSQLFMKPNIPSSRHKYEPRQWRQMLGKLPANLCCKPQPCLFLTMRGGGTHPPTRQIHTQKQCHTAGNVAKYPHYVMGPGYILVDPHSSFWLKFHWTPPS